MVSRSAFGDEIEEIEEFGEADGCGVRTLDQGLALGAEGGDAESHGDSVISAGVDDGAVQLLATRNVETIFEFFDFGSHGTQVARDESDAIGFFDPELFGVADADAAAGVGADGGEDGKFVDELSGKSTADFGGSEAIGIGGDLNSADEFRVRFLELKDGDARAERGEHVEKRGTRGVETDAVKDK